MSGKKRRGDASTSPLGRNIRFVLLYLEHMHGGKSEIVRDRLRQPCTNPVAGLTGTTPAIHQSHLPDRQNYRAYIAHRTRTRTYKKAQHTAARATIDVRSRHITNPRSTRFVSARPVNIDDGLDVIMWIRCLGGERLPTASYALCPNLNKLFVSPTEGWSFFVVCFLNTSRRYTFDLDIE